VRSSASCGWDAVVLVGAGCGVAEVVTGSAVSVGDSVVLHPPAISAIVARAAEHRSGTKIAHLLRVDVLRP
jgi:hypothetical protein